MDFLYLRSLNQQVLDIFDLKTPETIIWLSKLSTDYDSSKIFY